MNKVIKYLLATAMFAILCSIGMIIYFNKTTPTSTNISNIPSATSPETPSVSSPKSLNEFMEAKPEDIKDIVPKDVENIIDSVGITDIFSIVKKYVYDKESISETDMQKIKYIKENFSPEQLDALFEKISDKLNNLASKEDIKNAFNAITVD